MGELPQPTTGFGSLAIGCEPSFWSPHSLIDHTLDEMTLASGASATFSFEIRPTDFQRVSGDRAEDIDVIHCAVGMKIRGVPLGNSLEPYVGLDSDVVKIAVAHPPTATTTTRSVTP